MTPGTPLHNAYLRARSASTTEEGLEALAGVILQAEQVSAKLDGKVRKEATLDDLRRDLGGFDGGLSRLYAATKGSVAVEPKRECLTMQPEPSSQQGVLL